MFKEIKQKIIYDYILAGFILTPANYARGAHASVLDARLPWSYARKETDISRFVYNTIDHLIDSNFIQNIFSNKTALQVIIRAPKARATIFKLLIYYMHVLYTRAKLLRKIVTKNINNNNITKFSDVSWWKTIIFHWFSDLIQIPWFSLTLVTLFYLCSLQ